MMKTTTITPAILKSLTIWVITSGRAFLQKEMVFSVRLDKELMLANRNKFGFLRDRDSFTLSE